MSEPLNMDFARVGGLKVIKSDLMTIGPFEDWSRVRSPGRARRRRFKHRQNIRFFYKPDPNLLRMGDTVVGHPATVAALMAALSRTPPNSPVGPGRSTNSTPSHRQGGETT